MKKIVLPNINHSLSLKLCLWIFGVVVTVFIVAISFLFIRSRLIVQQEATERIAHTLDNTALQITQHLKEVEAATNNISWLALSNLTPDSLANYSRRVVELNPNINGCSITMEPGFFAPADSNFSVYTLREGESIVTAIEGDYNYYEKVWYKTPHDRGEACWVDPYKDFNEGTLSSPVMIASYGKPLHSRQGDFIGVISTDLSISWLSDIISTCKPYPNSYCMMLGADGHYYVHPDRLRLIKESIFSFYDEQKHPDIIALGKEMTAGNRGNMRVNLDGQSCMVFYQPLEDTGWSMALVCPESDIFASYKTLTYILVPLIIIGLLLILFICWKIINHFIKPLDLLAQQSRHIAEGNFDTHIPRSNRIDVVGDLQNCFVSMQESINEHIINIQQVNEETERRNAELVTANQLAQEAEQRKTASINEMSLQIRTPLNIIAGFIQVLQDKHLTMSEQEIAEAADSMRQNATAITRKAHMLFDVSWMEDRPLDLSKEVEVNSVVEDSIRDFNERSPHDMVLNYTSNLPKEHYIHTNRLYLHRSLREVLINAKKFAPQSTVKLDVEAIDSIIRFTIEDNGPGIPKSEQERVFEPFVKLDQFSEGFGLGLGLTLQHAKNLGGSFKIDPDYTNGARFIIEIPNA